MIGLAGGSDTSLQDLPTDVIGGDVVIVSPAAGKRRGDRVVVKTRAGAVTAGILQHLGLAGAALGLALAVSVPLALLRLRERAVGLTA